MGCWLALTLPLADQLLEEEEAEVAEDAVVAMDDVDEVNGEICMGST